MVELTAIIPMAEVGAVEAVELFVCCRLKLILLVMVLPPKEETVIQRRVKLVVVVVVVEEPFGIRADFLLYLNGLMFQVVLEVKVIMAVMDRRVFGFS